MLPVYLIYQNDGGPLGNMWEIIPQIKSIIALIAFIVAVSFWFLRHKVIQKRKMLENTPEDEKGEVASMILDDLHVKVDDLTKDQRYNLAMQKLKDRAKHRLTTSSLLAFLAIVAVLAIIFGNKTESKSESNQESEVISYEVFADIYSYSTDKRDRSGEFQHRNDHCEGPTPVNWHVAADTSSGWYIDVNSIVVNHTARSNDIYQGVFEQTKDGFYIRGIVRNSGECIFGGGDSRGKITAAYQFTEEKQIKTTESFEEEIKGELTLGNQEEIPIPENLANYTVIITERNGNRVELTNTNREKKGYSVSKVGDSKLIIK